MLKSCERRQNELHSNLQMQLATRAKFAVSEPYQFCDRTLLIGGGKAEDERRRFNYIPFIRKFIGVMHRKGLLDDLLACM